MTVDKTGCVYWRSDFGQQRIRIDGIGNRFEIVAEESVAEASVAEASVAEKSVAEKSVARENRRPEAWSASVYIGFSVAFRIGISI